MKGKSSDPYIQSVIDSQQNDFSGEPCIYEPCTHAAFYSMTCDNGVFADIGCAAHKAFPEGTTEGEIRATYEANAWRLSMRYRAYKQGALVPVSWKDHLRLAVKKLRDQWRQR